MTIDDSHVGLRGITRMPRRSEAGFTIVELLVVLALLATLCAIGLNYAMFAFDQSRVGRTVAEMRGVSNALTRYQSDTSTLPGGGLQPVSAIASVVQPTGGGLATVDGWNNPIYYTPYTAADGTQTFRLYSYGRDGSSDGVVTGTWVDFTSDIVVEGSAFIQTKW
jgi:general secretion pathway protein G